MILLLGGLGLVLAGGVAALLTARSARWSGFFGAGGTMVGCAVAMAPTLRALFGAGGRALENFGSLSFPIDSFRCDWHVPGGSFYVELDALSAFFLVPILFLSALAALYGSGYLRARRHTAAVGVSWFFFNLLVAGMALVVVARNAILFLVAWEVMSLSSFFLVTFENEKPEVREAGWIYLVATHLGTAFLLALFILLGRGSGSLDFDQFDLARGAAPAAAGVMFLLAVVGFGTKAGFMPMHVWLPEAQPAAPSHVSAVMSGVMIKTGIYGLLRTLTFLGVPPPWWGWLLVAIGISSGILGVLFALAQRDLKRMLAYSSVGNIGVIALGIGVGLLGQSSQRLDVALLGFGGAALHVINHALFKGLLFLGAGSVLHATGTRKMDRLGGLMKRMPWTGAMCCVGGVAISALPPLNGFVSEFLIYLGAFRSLSAGTENLLPMLATLAALALIGGLTSACFAKAFGIVFLGEPRSEEAAGAREAGWRMILPMQVLAAGCVGIGLLAPAAGIGLKPVLVQLARAPAWQVDRWMAAPCHILWGVTLAAFALLLGVRLLMVVRRRMLRGRDVRQAVTWDCGYARPTARMQYTASSFSQRLTGLFQAFLRTRWSRALPRGLFPLETSMASETPDAFREKLFRPFFTRVQSLLAPFRRLQHGRLQLYVLYIALTLIILLIWKLG